MNHSKLVFAQLMEHLPLTTFRRLDHPPSGRVHSEIVLVLGAVPVNDARADELWESLRDIEVCWRAKHSQIYHFAIRSTVACNTLANALRQI